MTKYRMLVNTVRYFETCLVCCPHDLDFKLVFFNRICFGKIRLEQAAIIVSSIF